MTELTGRRFRNHVTFNDGLKSIFQNGHPSSDQVRTLEFLVSIGVNSDLGPMVDFMAADGELKIIQLLYKVGKRCRFIGAFWAAANGCVHVIRWILKVGTLFKEFEIRRQSIMQHRIIPAPGEYYITTMDKKHGLTIHAALRGQKSMVQFLMQQQGHSCHVALLIELHASEGIRGLKDYTPINIDCSTYCVDLAAAYGYTNILHFFGDRGIHCSLNISNESFLCYNAAWFDDDNYVEVIQCLREENHRGVERLRVVDSECICLDNFCAAGAVCVEEMKNLMTQGMVTDMHNILPMWTMCQHAVLRFWNTNT